MTPWQHQAACLDEDPELFFRDHSSESYDPALAVCAGCPVVAPCLESALAMEGAGDAKSRYGVRGGTTPEQRARMVRREQRRARAEAAT